MIWFDWRMAFWPALQAWLAGKDPYTVAVFLSPPWLLPLIAPFGLLPPAWGAFGMDLLAVSGLIAVCRRLCKPWAAVLVGVSAVFLYVLLDANVEGYVLWGLALGGPVGLLLLSVKPQAAILVAVIWGLQAWQRSRWRGVLVLLAPTVFVALVFTALYPQWLAAVAGARRLPAATDVNLWPWLLPVAGGLLLLAVARQREGWAALATTLSVPYFQFHSYIGALALVTGEYPWIGAAGVAASWVYVLVAYLGILRI